MKFRFIGEKKFNTNNIYEILQFELVNKHFCAYVIDDNNKLTFISYPSMDKFNENWSYVYDD